VDQWRPIIEWREEEVWGLIRKFGVRPHPAYFLGWGRLSCFPCIFGSPNQWASVRAMDPELFAYILSLERQFDYTIDVERNIEEAANLGSSFVPNDPANVRLAFSEDYPEDLVLVPEGQWTLPLGALGQVKGSAGGPT
jgi:3'-phosphoadenosine 5'-phosphosulfate sulfotransferase (PAPS reductase)/FAD synthetase